MDNYLLFGKPVSHSLSPQIHQLFAEQTQQLLTYHAQEVAPENFPETMQHFFANGGNGANVTAPLKILAAQLVDHLTPAAQLGSVNTLIRLANGQLLGDNSDGYGLIKDLHRQQLSVSGAHVLLVGSGGAARGILPSLLAEKPSEILLLNRTIPNAMTLANACQTLGVVRVASDAELRHAHIDLIIQAVPGPYLSTLQSWLSHLSWQEVACYDLNYSLTQSLTPFLLWARQQGAKQFSDGLGMLVEQAAYAFHCWRKVTPRVEEVLNKLRQLRT